MIEEQQDIVYLAIPDAFNPPKKRPLPDNPGLRQTAEASEALLFRYSAITFNAHRIHYDLPYAQAVENYPGLVIHGPLQAMWLIEAARAPGPSATAFRFSRRASLPADPGRAARTGYHGDRTKPLRP